MKANLKSEMNQEQLREKRNLSNEKKVCAEKGPLTDELIERMDKWWRAANYLSAGQLYLLDNPLLKEPLTMDMIKKKIVGHWARCRDKILFLRILTG